MTVLWLNPPEWLTRVETMAPVKEGERRRLYVLQYCNLLAVVTMLGFAALYLATDTEVLLVPALASLACVPFYFLAWWLNRVGYGTAAKVTFLSVLSGSIFLSTFYLVGPAPGLHFYFLLAAVLPLLLWPLHQIAWIALFMTASLAGFLIVQNRPSEWPLVVAFPSEWLGLYSGMAVVASYVTAVALLAALQHRAESDTQAREALLLQFESLSNTDPLTGLHNRRSMMRRLEEEKARMSRNHSTFALLLGDVDFFKNINDTHGHEAGDVVLTGLGALLKSALRDIDSVARWGGEEFLILLPDTSAEGALIVGKKLCALVAAAEFPSEGVELKCTITFGLALEDENSAGLHDTIRRADAALYDGKRRGRNQVVLDAPENKAPGA